METKIKNKEDKSLIAMQKEEILIDCVRRNPELYDPHHPMYGVSGKKTQIWADIAREVGGESARTCKTRWNSIRDTYRKSVYRNAQRIQNGEKPKYYKYSQSLGFLKKIIKFKNDDEDDDEAENAEEDSESVQEDLAATKKRRFAEDNDRFNEEVYMEYYPDVSSDDANESTLVGYQQQQVQLQSSQGMSTMDSFLSCIGVTLKSLPPYYASLAKAEIFASVHKYELRAITDTAAAPVCAGAARTGGSGGGVQFVSASNSESASISNPITIKTDPLEQQ